MTDARGEVLIPIARNAIAGELDMPRGQISHDLPWLQEKGATFVTLTQQQRLRGCIGSLEARRTLLLDVQSNARAAAFQDPRFAPLREEELEITEIEVSLLSAAEPVRFSNEQDALAQLRPGVDGVIFQYGHYRSTFLPQVWEQLPEPEVFMAHLKHKAGLHPAFWHEDVRLQRYTVTKWKEKDLQRVAEKASERGSR